MKKAAKPLKERERLQNLESYSILDTPPEQVFDDLTILASQICEAPIALISFVDSARQWFKSRVGISAGQTARDIAFCAHTILKRDVFVVEDALTDRRFADNPLVQSEPFVRFYAGSPLISPEGFALGTLCVIDRKPRELSGEQLKSLEILARQVVRELVMRRFNNQQEMTIQALQTAKHALSQTEDIVENTNDLVQSMDGDGRLVYVNRAWCTTLGYSREEALGLTIWDVLDSASVAHYRQTLARLVRGEAVDQFEGVFISQDGRRRPFDGSLNCRIVDGQAVAAWGIFRDVTSKKFDELRRHDAEEQYTRLFESSIEGIVQIGIDGKILKANPAMARMLGYDSADDFIDCHNNKGFPLYVDPVEQKRLVSSLVRRGKVGAYECRLFRKDGSIIWTRGSGRAVRANYRGLLFFEGVVSDITDTKVFEEQLRQTNLELEKRNRQIEVANRLKSEFLANMSHELRTPLNGIIGFAEIMHDGAAGGPVTDEQKEFLGDILTSARHLLQLINDILDLSKIEAGKIELRPESFDLARLVEEVCDIVKPMAAKKRIQIGTRIDEEIRQLFLDPAKLKQVLYNYLSNAVKFTPENGKIRIAAYGQGPKHFRLEVVDSGIGIAPEDRQRLFIEFQQLDEGAAKKYQGTGLGLALTKRIVETQGGSVGMTSELGAGSTFFAILPRRLEGVKEPPLARHPAAAGSNAGKLAAHMDYNILVVAEDINALKLVDATLRPLGYNLICRSAERDGLEAAKTTRLDAIVLDLALPGNNGMEFLNHLRQTEGGAGVPVIIWTSKDLTDEETTSLSKLTQSIISKRHGDIRRLVDELRVHLAANSASPPSRAVEPKV